MKKTLLLIIGLLCTTNLIAQTEDESRTDSIEKSFTYQHGTITLRNGIGTINIPEGFKYLDPVQAEKVLVDLWGNPKSNTSLGMLLPEDQKILSQDGYVFNIEYDEIGYIKDDDADEINYDDLLNQMQKETEDANAERVKNNYPPITLIGWASQPFYDKENKVLHWAENLKFGTVESNTLNYNVRILGRKGVLILNAISTMKDLPLVKKDISKVLHIVQFADGYAYKDFDPSVDQVAAWTIGGLVAGKVLAKAGFFAVIVKFGKVIALAVIGFFAAIWKRIRGKSKESNELENELEPVTEETNNKE